MAFKNPLTCKEIAKIINGKIFGDDSIIINNLNRIEYSHKGDLTFFKDIRYEKHFHNTNADCILVSNDYKGDLPNKTLIYVADPYLAFVELINIIYNQEPKRNSFIHNTAIIGENVKIHESAYIGPYCVVMDNCVINENVVLTSNITLYDNTNIGENTKLHSNVVCYTDTIIGKNCVIHAGAVIGSDGFGFVEDKTDGSYTKIPQIGNVIVEDDVEIGANTTIDRALIGSTIIGKGVKIDNLVQIAHNCIIGENSAFAAQVGIAGSAKIGKRSRIGGQVGIVGHIELDDDVTIMPQSGVTKRLKKGGIYLGSPAKEADKAYKIEAATRMLPDLIKEFTALKNNLNK